MAEFTALGMVELEELGNDEQPLVQVRLNENLSCVFEKQFGELRGHYTPSYSPLESAGILSGYLSVFTVPI
jgi:hypothetical protein